MEIISWDGEFYSEPLLVAFFPVRPVRMVPDGLLIKGL